MKDSAHSLSFEDFTERFNIKTNFLTYLTFEQIFYIFLEMIRWVPLHSPTKNVTSVEYSKSKML